LSLPISKREHKALVPLRPARMVQPRPIVLWMAKGYRRYWFLLALLIFAGGAVATAFAFQVWPLATLNQAQVPAPDFEIDRHPRQANSLEQKGENRTPRLIIQNSRTTVNQPLPLGIVLNDSAGEETLVFSGFVEGTSFSAGTALSATRWSMPGRDLDKAFISAPQNFDGIMQVTVTLYSSRQEIFETKEVRFEWNNSHKGDKLPVQISPAPRLAR
jgi:hypothetical protein